MLRYYNVGTDTDFPVSKDSTIARITSTVCKPSGRSGEFGSPEISFDAK